MNRTHWRVKPNIQKPNPYSRIATLETELAQLEKTCEEGLKLAGNYFELKAELEARVKAADDALSLAIHNKEKAENAARLIGIELEKQTNLVPSLKARIATLEAQNG